MNKKTDHFEQFSDLASLEALCKSSSPFSIVFAIGAGLDKQLHRVVELSANAPTVLGVVFSVENTDVDHRDIFFLKECVEKILIAGKRVGLWGISGTVQRRLLGGYLYMRFHCDAILPEGIEQSVFQEKPGESASSVPFDSQSSLLKDKHEAFIQHCRSIESPTTLRRVYYVTNIDYHSQYSYQDRFIYQCDYPSPREYSLEYEFLKAHAINRSYVEKLESLSDITRTSQIAYSLAEKEGHTRESFYMFVTFEYGDKLLVDLGIEYEVPQVPDMQFFGAGQDVVDGELVCHKLYFRSPKSFIIGYFRPYGIDVSALCRNSHYLVLRLDQHQRLQSYKIEMQFTYEDLPLLQALLQDYDYFQEHLEHGQPYNMAVEFEGGGISKVNVYHRDVLPQ